MGMRILVGAACIAIIAAVGYYFVGEYRQAKADAEVAEYQALRSQCLSALRDISISGNQTIVANCLFKGALTGDDVDRRKRELGIN